MGLRTTTASLADRNFKRILLIKLSAVGDVIHTMPLLRALRRRYPGAQIDWLLKPSVAEFIRHHPDVSNVLVYGENHTEVPQYNWDGFTHFVGLIRDAKFVSMLRGLRAARYDLVIDVHGQLRTGFVALVTGAPVRIGFERPRRAVWEPAGKSLPDGTIERAWKGAREGAWLAYTHNIRLDTLDLHAVDRYLLAGKLLGIESQPPDFTFPIPPAARARIDALLRERGIAAGAGLILISPAALWETKRWLPQGFAAVARHFLTAGRPVVLIGSERESAECRAIAEAAPGAVDFSGRTSLVELAALVNRAALCLTNDSGPMHLAAALDRPVLGIFGPTNPAWVGPHGPGNAVLTANRPCSPCYLRNVSRCPHDLACMRDIQPERIITQMEAMLMPGQHDIPTVTRAG
jgi:heptosyltransferase I